MTNPKISVIIPVYNSEKYLAECIDSILAQTFTLFECILIDDKSTDNSAKICDMYAQKDSRIKVIYNAVNMGSSLSRKNGLDAAAGDYIQFIDSDDWIENNMLEKMYEKAVSGNFDMVYSDCYWHDETGVSHYKKIEYVNDFIQNIKNIILGYNKGSGLPYKMVKRSIYNGIIFPYNGYAEDKYITAQVFHKVKSTGFVNAAFYHYRYNPVSQRFNNKRQKNRYIGLKMNFNEIFNFLKNIYGNNLKIFEPELSIRKGKIKEEKISYQKNVVKYILKILIPFKPVRKALKSMYNKIKKHP